MNIQPDYPHFWILVTPKEMVGPFYGEQAAKDWATERGLDYKWIEQVTYTTKWDEDHHCPMSEADSHGRH